MKKPVSQNPVPSEIRDMTCHEKIDLFAFAKPAKQFGAPSADIDASCKPVTASGYSSAEVVVTPGRILLAVPVGCQYANSEAAHRVG